MRAVGPLPRDRRSLVPARATFPAARSCRACCRSRRSPRWARSAVCRTPTSPGRLALFAGIDDVRFKRIVVPGGHARAAVRDHAPARADRQGRRRGDGRRRAGLPRAADVRPDGARGVIAIVPARRRVARRRVVRARAGDVERRDRDAGRRPATSGSPSAPASASGGSPPTASRRPARCAGPPERALESAGVDPAEIDLIVAATASPDYYFPATASLIGERHRRAARRPGTTCRRPAPASSTRWPRPTRQIAAGMADTVLVVGSGGVLAPAGLGRPLDLHPVRRRRRRGGARPRRDDDRDARVRAGRRRLGRRAAVGARGRAHAPSKRRGALRADERAARCTSSRPRWSVESATRCLDGGRA